MAIGRTEKGFDFLGYHISPEGLSLANKTVEREPRVEVPDPSGSTRGPSVSRLVVPTLCVKASPSRI